MKKLISLIFLALVMLAVVSCGNNPEKCKHKFGSPVTVKESTCSEAGKQVEVCSKCQFTQESELATLPHTEIILPAVEPTCVSEGLTEGLSCSVCGSIIKAQESILANGHSFVDGNCACGATNGKKQIIISNASASAGDTVSITVMVSGNTGIASLILSLEFDNSALTLEKIEYNKTIGGMTMQPEENASPVKLYWISALEEVAGDFILATLTFKISENAPRSNYNITLSYNRDNVYDIDENAVFFEKVNGKITVN